MAGGEGTGMVFRLLENLPILAAGPGVHPEGPAPDGLDVCAEVDRAAGLAVDSDRSLSAGNGGAVENLWRPLSRPVGHCRMGLTTVLAGRGGPGFAGGGGVGAKVSCPRGAGFGNGFPPGRGEGPARAGKKTFAGAFSRGGIRGFCFQSDPAERSAPADGETFPGIGIPTFPFGRPDAPTAGASVFPGAGQDPGDMGNPAGPGWVEPAGGIQGARPSD